MLSKEAIRLAPDAEENKLDNLRIEFEKGYFKDYEKNVLCANRCGIFAPMSFIESEDKEIVSYDCSGYSSLKKSKILK